MDGQHLKNFLAAHGVVLAELARRLGYDTDQRLHSVLRSQDVRTGFLESVAKVLNKDISWFYGNNNAANAETTATLTEQLNRKDEQIQRLLAVIENLSK